MIPERMSCWEWFFDHMGNVKVLIDFDEEARRDDYIPYAAWQWREGGNPPVLVNYDFSRHLWARDITYDTNFDDHPPTYDITSEMNIIEG